MTPRIRLARPWWVMFVITAAAAMAMPAVVSAHAELVTASPADGDTVVGTPPEIHATYSENLNPDGSSLGLYDASNARVARGGVASDGGPKEMFIRNLPSLSPGAYTVKSTTRSADDGDLDRVEWTFTVTAPTPSATPAATAASPSAEATASPTGAPSPTASPSPSPGTGTSTAGTGDVTLPIIVALAIIAIGAAYLLTRGRRSGRA